MFKALLTLIGCALVGYLLLRSISKLPSRYERKPREISPWSALDQGIDPSLEKESGE